MPSVSISSNKGYLRLRWTYQRERYCLSLGLKDSKTNRKKAQAIILQIEADIETEELDVSLAKYQTQRRSTQQDLTCLALYQKWLEFKAKFVDSRTIDWYRLTEAKLGDMGNTIADNLTHSQAIQFLTQLQSENLAPQTIKRQLENLRACWDWGIKRQIIKVSNPWDELVPLIRVTAPAMPQPFTKAEVAIIFDKFGELYPELLPFVRFLFGTGCRTGEARGLLWGCLDKSCSKCAINGQLSRAGTRKPTKTGKSRTLQLPPSLQEMLAEMRSQSTGEYVFLLNGQPIKEFEFQHRWERALKKAGLKHRKPYNTRHTFISHALEQKLDPMFIAKQTGHSVRVLFDHYAGLIQENAKLPEIF